MSARLQIHFGWVIKMLTDNFNQFTEKKTQTLPLLQCYESRGYHFHALAEIFYSLSSDAQLTNFHLACNLIDVCVYVCHC